jgi:glycine cleavage system T protein (aminomethyltransferase)
VRTAAGLFDVSHMGEIETRGPEAAPFIRHLLTNDIERVGPWGAQYSLVCREDGGVLDDLFTYRFPPEPEPRFLTVVNAANAASDFAWFAEHADGWSGVEVVYRSNDYAMLALQGPKALALAAPLLGGTEAPGRFRFVEATIAGVAALVCRTGYTGEDGIELLVRPDAAETLWNAIVEAGATPAGLGARDTLRLEVCYPLYGNDLSVDRTPIEAGLGWACALDKDFVGAEVLREQSENGVAERLAPFEFLEPGIPRPGCAILSGETAAGTVTSGTLSPCLEIGIGMGYVQTELNEPGTDVTVDVRGKRKRARIASKPLYERKKGDHA